MSVKILNKVIKLRKQGMTLKDALKECNLDYHTYYQYAHDNGLPLRVIRKTRKYTKTVARAVKKRINGGEYLRDICKDMKLDQRTLYRFCSYNGIKLYSKKALARSIKKTGEGKRGKKHNRAIPFIITSRVPTILGYLFYSVDPIDIAVELNVSAGYVRRLGDMLFPDWEELQD